MARRGLLRDMIGFLFAMAVGYVVVGGLYDWKVRMTKRRVEWRGGPVDGLADRLEYPQSTWVAPDPAEPSKAIVYVLHTTGNGGVEYRFDRALTDRANEERGIAP